MGKPGVRKKKNAGVGVDFKRVKHKIGKKLPRAQNQTDTSFKSRTINLAEQSVAADKSGQAVTARNLTLKEVLGQCGHYSDRVRREALQGLSELVAGHPDELRRHTTLVVEAAAARIADGDAAVRSAARELLGSTLLPALGGTALAPFVPLLMAHVCAAMTHLAEPIRADALGFLELLMGARPDLVAAGFLAPVLHHFSDLLSRGSRGRSIRAGSLASLQSVVAALERFLAKAAAALAGGVGTSAAGSIAAATAGTAAAAAAADGAGGFAQGSMCGDDSSGGGVGNSEAQPVLFWRRCAWPPPRQSSWVAVASDSVGGNAAGAADGGGAEPATEVAAEAAAEVLLGHLLECWSEAGPSQLAESPELLAAQCLTSILRCCDLLLGHWGSSMAGSGHSRTNLAASLIRKVAPHFPLHRPTVALAPQLAEQLVQLNVAAAQLLARFLPGQQTATGAVLPAAASGGQQRGRGNPPLPGSYGGSNGGGSGRGHPNSPASDGGREEHWVVRLLDWFAGVMAEGMALPTADSDHLFGAAPGPPAELDAKIVSGGSGKRARGGKKGSSSGGITGDVYQSALDGTLRVLPLLPVQRRQQLLAAAWSLWQRSAARSGARARVLAFWQALLRDPIAAFYAPTPAGGPLLQHAEVAAWLAALPRFLFELGSSSPLTSQAALALLLDAARTAPPGSPLAESLQELQPQLASLFAVLLPATTPSSGKKQQQQQQPAGPRVHVGPLASLPPAIQEKAVDLQYHFPAATEQLLRTAAIVCLGDAYPTATAVRLLEVVAARAAAGAADPAAFCGLLLNVLSGSSTAGLQQGNWRRHEAVVAAACAAATRLGEPAELATVLLPPFMDSAVSQDGSLNSTAAYGLLQLAIALAAAAASAQKQLKLPATVATAIPRLMLQLLASCQQAQQAKQPQPQQGAGVTSGNSETLDSQAMTTLCLQLVCLQTDPLLQLLLEALPSSLASGQVAEPLSAAAAGSSERKASLPAVLQLLQALLREQRLREGLLAQQATLQAALAACRASAEAAGSDTQDGREQQQQLQHLEALCAVVLGG